MTYQFENESTVTFSFDWEKTAQEVINEALEFENCPYEAEINLLITDNNQIQQMNKEFRQIDAPTDVLSFPLIDYENPSDFTGMEDYEEDYFNPDSGELMLGDIVISADKVIEQAEAFGHSVRREFAFLIAHSMLHLLGYDHMTESEEIVMTGKQEAILERLHITRD